MATTKQKSLEDLLDMVKAAEAEQEFDICADLQELVKQYRKLNAKAYKALLAALIEKYSSGEYNVVHAALIQNIRAGDAASIKLWSELRAARAGGENAGEVVIVDDIPTSKAD